MAAPSPTLEWSQREPDIAVADVERLDRALDVIAEQCATDRPTIVKLCGNGYNLTFGLGSPQSFVQHSQPDDEPPYLVTVGDSRAVGQVAFYFLGEHYTEIPRRHLIPSVVARQVVREFFSTGRCSVMISWEEV